jgi:hypothetical protein
MLSAPAPVRAQLSEALSIISAHDFPHAWPTLLPELVEKLNTTDPTVINGVLETANSIFKRYRGQYGNDVLIAELDKSQQVFAPTLLAAQQKLSSLVPAAEGDAAALKLVLSCVRLSFRIYFSLNSPGLTPVSTHPPQGAGIGGQTGHLAPFPMVPKARNAIDTSAGYQPMPGASAVITGLATGLG